MGENNSEQKNKCKSRNQNIEMGHGQPAFFTWQSALASYASLLIVVYFSRAWVVFLFQKMTNKFKI